MKKFIVLLFCMFFTVLSAFSADYKLPPQYKTEIEQTIDNQYYISINQINNIYKEAAAVYKKISENPHNLDLYYKFAQDNYETLITSPEFSLYLKLLEITKKYTYISDEELPETDFSGGLYDFLYPYFQYNKINITKLNKISEYAAIKQELITEYYEQAHKLIYPEEY